MSVDIITFLQARLDEDEVIGRQALQFNDTESSELYVWSDEAIVGGARVLREVEMKRKLIKEFAPIPTPRSDTELHAAFAHPAYEYQVAEGQRKAWDFADEPPPGDGWRRNTDAGRDGWERFDYHEESYWLQLRPEGPHPSYTPRALRLLAAVYADHPDYNPEWCLQAASHS